MERLPCTRVVSSRYHVENCNFSPDSKLLAACFGDFTVRLLRIGEQRIDDPSSGDDHAHPSIHVDVYWVIKEHNSNVWCARFSPDSLLLCTSSSDKTAKIWNVNSRTLERNFDFHTDTVWTCCFAPVSSSPARLVATGSSDKTVKVWNTESGKVLHDLGGYGDAIDCLDFSSSGELLCTTCRDGVVKIWINLSVTQSDMVSNTDCFVEPICLDLTAVNRSASRFCMFSTLFSSYVNESKLASSQEFLDKANSELATHTSIDNEAATTVGAHFEDTHEGEVLFDTIDHLICKSELNELLFAGGPENSLAVWSLGDIVTAFKSLLSEVDTKSSQTCQDFNKDVPSKVDGHPDSSEEENEARTDDHVDDSFLRDSNSKKGYALINQQVGSTDVEISATQLRTIIEEEETQSDITERTDQEDSNSDTTQTSLENLVINGESSYISDEPFTFYKVEPKWTLTDHLSIVWDCCMATLQSSKHNVISRGETVNDVQVLISCSGDRTLRFWKFANDINPLSCHGLNCVKVFQMPDEHSESQILTCASCSTNHLLAIGLFNGSLHLASLSDLCSAVDSGSQ